MQDSCSIQSGRGQPDGDNGDNAEAFPYNFYFSILSSFTLSHFYFSKSLYKKLFVVTVVTIDMLRSRQTMKLMAFQGKEAAGLLIGSQEAGWPFCLERQGKTMMQFWLIVNKFAIKHGKINT